MFELKRTPFHERTSKLCLPQNWRRWAGYIVAGSYELTLDREYWAIRNSAALIDVTMQKSEPPATLSLAASR